MLLWRAKPAEICSGDFCFNKWKSSSGAYTRLKYQTKKREIPEQVLDTLLAASSGHTKKEAAIVNL